MEDISSEVTGKPEASSIFVFVIFLGSTPRLEVEQKLEFLANLILDLVIFLVQKWPFSLGGKRIPWQSTEGVDRYNCRAPHFHMHSHCTVRSHVFLGSSSRIVCSKIRDPSTCYVSSCASLHIEHQHKFSHTYLSCVIVVLYSESRPVVSDSVNPLQRSTAG